MDDIAMQCKGTGNDLDAIGQIGSLWAAQVSETRVESHDLGSVFNASEREILLPLATLHAIQT